MLKLLIVQDLIPHYRLPIFKYLGSQYDLTVTSTHKVADSEGFRVELITLKQVGGFYYWKSANKLRLRDFDIVIHTFNIRWLNLWYLAALPFRPFKFLVWGIGVSTETGFDTIRKWDWLRYAIARKSNAVIFYSDYPILRYVEEGRVKREKMFVAHNTLDLPALYFDDDKEYFLFVGTMKKYKRVDHLISLYANALIIYPELPDLHMIGDGDYMSDLRKIIIELGVSEKIKLHGEINDLKRLAHFYRKAIACVSPSQAGLTVLQAMSMGVPFVTKSDAVTGGERFNVINGHNGIVADSDNELELALIKLAKDSSYASELGKKALSYFKDNCTVKRMVDGFVNAINSVF
jgi:glycosyltransferase involved in cell wall biosynthesis